MICCVSRAKIHFEGRKIDESFSFLTVFQNFLIFSILGHSEMLWLSILIFWLDFLPGTRLKSLWAGISSLFKFAPALIHFSGAGYSDLAV